MAVDDVMISVLFGRGAHPQRVGSGVFGLGHGEAATDLATDQGKEKLLVLFRCAVQVEEFHVADIRRMAVEQVMAQRAATQYFADMGELG